MTDWGEVISKSQTMPLAEPGVGADGPWTSLYRVAANDGRNADFPGKPPFVVLPRDSTGLAISHAARSKMSHAATASRSLLPIAFAYSERDAMRLADEHYRKTRKLVAEFYDGKPPPPRPMPRTWPKESE